MFENAGMAFEYLIVLPLILLLHWQTTSENFSLPDAARELLSGRLLSYSLPSMPIESVSKATKDVLAGPQSENPNSALHTREPATHQRTEVFVGPMRDAGAAEGQFVNGAGGLEVSPFTFTAALQP